jgi:hypothetical protein
VARQSKSLVLGLWDKEELVSSNNNLNEVELKGEISDFVVISETIRVKIFNISEFQIPPGGVEAGLFGRMVLVRRGESL